DLVPTVVGIDRLARIELQVARQQVPGRDRQIGRDYQNDARREGPPANYSRKKSRCNLQHFRFLCSVAACLRARYSTATVRERLNIQGENAVVYAATSRRKESYEKSPINDSAPCTRYFQSAGTRLAPRQQ